MILFALNHTTMNILVSSVFKLLEKSLNSKDSSLKK